MSIASLILEDSPSRSLVLFPVLLFAMGLLTSTKDVIVFMGGLAEFNQDPSLICFPKPITKI